MVSKLPFLASAKGLEGENAVIGWRSLQAINQHHVAGDLPEEGVA